MSPTHIAHAVAIQVQVYRVSFGRIDLDAMEKALEDLDGQPGLVIINAGEVNVGEFDPLSTQTQLLGACGRGIRAVRPVLD